MRCAPSRRPGEWSGLNVRDGFWYYDYSWYDLNNINESNIAEANGFTSTTLPYDRLYEASWTCRFTSSNPFIPDHASGRRPPMATTPIV